ncbi:MAG: C1 family peptidase [Bacteroidales bacterium]
MKKSIALVALLSLFITAGLSLIAQEGNIKEPRTNYQITDVEIIPHTSVKDQHRSGTCWSYAGVSFVEAEVIRRGGPVLDLSDMYPVRYAYVLRAQNYMRLHGNFNFGPGGEPHHVMETLAERGMITEEAYSGLTIGEDLPVHGEMDHVLSSFVKAVEENKNRKLSPVWMDAYESILDVYLGEVPAEFEYENQMYTPQTFARDIIGLDTDNYAEITSFTHKPYYKPFMLMIPDNWDFHEYYNVPLDELDLIIDAALEYGYTIAWAADVSDPGFNHKLGLAIVPETDWEEMDHEERDSVFKTPVAQRKITPEMRQEAYDNHTTTDDHIMHIVGLAEDKEGNVWYKVKNSWAEDSNECGGYFYASKAYLLYKTLAIYVNKDAVPKGIARKLGW